MKKALILSLCLIGAVSVHSQWQVSADSLKYFEGEIVNVCSEVTSTYCTPGKEKTTFLTFGTFPHQLFTVVIYQEHLSKFSYNPVEYLKGKQICITGDVRMYLSGPEIIVESEDQIRIEN